MANSNGRTGKIISLLSAYFAANVIFILGPALHSFATEVYPNVDYSTVLLLSTLSSLLMIPGSLFAGAVMGKKLSFRMTALLSMGGIVIAGAAPYFVRDINFALVMRAIVGFCIGMG